MNLNEIMKILATPLYVDINVFGFTFCYMDMIIVVALFSVVIVLVRRLL